MKFFKDLKKILDTKNRTLKSGGATIGIQDGKSNKPGVNRLVIQP